MKSKADFYVGIGSNSEWIGTLMSEGDIWNIPVEILIQNNKIMFEHMVWDHLYSKGSYGVVADNPFTKKMWPHDYKTSADTEYVFIFDENIEKVVMYHMGLIVDPIKILQGDGLTEATEYEWECNFPCMIKESHSNG